jgi:hypothetical protein
VFWIVTSFPHCTHHVFLSHCAEDRETLVYPLFQALRQRGIVPWLDRHDYPYGRSSRAALRDSILRCRHTVFLITDAMLASARGWCVQELAWSELLQDNLRYPGGDLLNLILPLYFVEQADGRLPRSVWQVLRDKRRFCSEDVERGQWAATQIEEFLRREEQYANELRSLARRSDFAAHLKKSEGLRDRVTRVEPRPLPDLTTPETGVGNPPV